MGKRENPGQLASQKLSDSAETVTSHQNSQRVKGAGVQYSVLLGCVWSGPGIFCVTLDRSEGCRERFLY